MSPNLIRMTTLSVVLVFTGTLAFAAGSSSFKAKDTRPGVSEYNSGVKLMKKGKYERHRRSLKPH